MNNKHILISDKNKIICSKLISLGYELIYTDCVDEFISYEQNHTDMQCICVEEMVFILKNCAKLKYKLQENTQNIIVTEKSAHKKYPNNVLLNAKIIGNNIIGKIDALDSTIIDYCTENNYRLINVKQGYSGCSILKINDNAIITTDESIYRTIYDTDIDVLKISQNGISLQGAKRGEQGLIGGASINLEDRVLFFGDIRKHDDYDKIKEFCKKYKIEIDYIDNLELTDIGGGILLNY